jgi:hypothetical protein
LGQDGHDGPTSRIRLTDLSQLGAPGLVKFFGISRGY